MLGQLTRGDRRAADLKPLLDAFEMRRREQAGAVARPLEHGGEHGRRGALALAARHVDDAQPAMRLAEKVQQRPHAIERQVARLGRAPLIVDAAKPEAQGLVVAQRRHHGARRQHRISLRRCARSRACDGSILAGRQEMRMSRPARPCTENSGQRFFDSLGNIPRKTFSRSSGN